MSDFQFRNVFNPTLVNDLRDNLARAWPPFNRDAFVDAIVPQLPALSFGDRNSLIADALRAHLPNDFPVAAQILVDALGPEPDTDELSGFDGFIIMPQCLFVSRYGLTSHALRTLLKQGHAGALRLLGYDPAANIAVSKIHLSHDHPAIGDEITFSFTVTSHADAPCALMIDYVIYFLKANGKQAAKVFKAAKKTIAPGQTISIEKKHSFRQRSTRKHYPGAHGVAVQINGKKYSSVDFVLQNRE